MKPTALILVVFLTLCACSNKEDCGPLPEAALPDITFKEAYISCFPNDYYFLVKGVFSETYKKGRNFEVLEDLKGNWTDEASVFVWNTYYYYDCNNERVEKPTVNTLSQYHKNDTLIMFITKDAYQRTGYELSGNLPMLIFSNDSVTGYIDRLGRSMLWKDLQEELQTFLNMEEKPSWWAPQWKIPEAFSTVYKVKYNSDKTFFIQGLVLAPYHYLYDYDAKRIEIISDLKGNFPEETTTFVAWGGANDFMRYNNQDTLLMLLQPLPEYLGEGDKTYGAFPVTFSVLKLLNDSVSGYITSCYKGEETMSMEDFQILLNSK